jgi:hypothetical protein
MLMSPSRKLCLIGMIAGGWALLTGILAFTLPLLLAFYTMSTPRRMMNLDAHFGVLAGSLMSWVIAAPIGIILLVFGAPTFLFSLIIYIDTRRKEAIRVTRQ